MKSDDAIYDLKAKMLSGEEITLEKYRGKVLLIVNTASKCGFTPQFAGLEELYKKYKDKGLEILGFPCNQFMNQEPGGKEEIGSVCYVNYGVTFPMFDKINVNGPDAHPLYVFLKKSLPQLAGTKIKWNFTKFLVDQEGRPVKRFSPATKPEKLIPDVEKLLKA